MTKFSKDYQPDNSRRHPPFSSTNQPKNRGRLSLKKIPKGARERIIEALWHALSLPDQKTAQEYLLKTSAELPEYGYLIQVYAKGMMGKNGIAYVADLLDRILGKPRQQTDLNLNAGTGSVKVVVSDEAAAEGLRHALETGARPGNPEDEETDD